MSRWQSIHATGQRFVRDTGQAGPVRQVLTGIAFLILLAIFLIPVVILGAVLLLLMLLRALGRSVLGLFSGAAAALPRDDGRRNVRIRAPQREE